MITCVYCGNPKGDRLSCCGENHWEEIPECPMCGAEHVSKDDDAYRCEFCNLKWTDEQYDALAMRPLGWGLLPMNPEGAER